MKVEKHPSSHPARSVQTGDRQLQRHDVAMQEGELEDECEDYEEVHVYAERGAEVAVHREGQESKEGNTMAGTKVKLMQCVCSAPTCDEICIPLRQWRQEASSYVLDQKSQLLRSV